LPQAVGYAEAALASPQPRLRRLGAAQLGRLLLLQAADAGQRREAAGTLAGALEVRPLLHCHAQRRLSRLGPLLSSQ
jgi:hypothetical protein